MATYDQLHDIMTDNIAGGTAQVLRQRVQVACFIAASVIINGADTVEPWDQEAGDHDKRLMWVARLLGNPTVTARELFNIVIAAYASSTQSQILTASDATIQGAVNSSIDALASNL